MTVTYTAKVATSSFGCFLKLLFRWRGSVYKLLWKEFIFFLLTYFALSILYRFILDRNGKRIFEMISHYCEEYNNLIPLSFVLGFFVSIVLSRWQSQFNYIPWPDTMAVFVTANVHGHDERGRLMRRTILRYVCLAYLITMASISPPVKKRFPTYQHMTDAGFLLANEEKILTQLQTVHNKYFIPIVWATSLVTRARKECRIKDDFAVKTLVDELNQFRSCLGALFNYDWISVPLVYTQVVTIAVYMFLISCLMARQFLEASDEIDVYVPVFTFLQFFFYMGWLKVAESLVNPFGEDDDDFDINWVIDRNLQICYLIVDEMHSEHPELIKDQYWDEVDFELPYTSATEPHRVYAPHIGSAVDINVDSRDAEFMPLSSIREVDGPVAPTDIPTKKAATHPPSAPSTTGLWHSVKQSMSKESRNTTYTDTPHVGLRSRQQQQRGGEQQLSRPASANSLTISVPASPRSTQEIFNMSDLDIDDDPLSEVTWQQRKTTTATATTMASKQRPRRRKQDSDMDSLYGSQVTITSSPPGGHHRHPVTSACRSASRVDDVKLGGQSEVESLLTEGQRGDEGKMAATGRDKVGGRTADDLPLLVLSDSIVCDKNLDVDGKSTAALKKCTSLNTPALKLSAV